MYNATKHEYCINDQVSHLGPLGPFCENIIENEIHFVISCPKYKILREPLFSNLNEQIKNFSTLSDKQKFICILTNPNEKVGRFVRKIMEILEFLIKSYRQKT